MIFNSYNPSFQYNVDNKSKPFKEEINLPSYGCEYFINKTSILNHEMRTIYKNRI